MDGLKKIAIVGTSQNLDTHKQFEIVDTIQQIILSYNKEEYGILSGGAKGIDTFAVDIAKNLRYKYFIVKSSGYAWNDYKIRNDFIANECSELYCITTKVKNKWCYHHTPHEDHEKTAGCWTMNKALEYGKPCKLVIV